MQRRKKHLEPWINIAFGFASVAVILPAWGQTTMDNERLLENPQAGFFSTDTITSSSPVSDLSIEDESAWDMLLAGPQNLNPSLALPAPVSLDEREPSNDVGDLDNLGDLDDLETLAGVDDLASVDDPTTLEDSIADAHVPFIEWDDLELDLSDSLSNFGQGNRFLTPILRGHLANGNIVTLSPGYNKFSLPDLESVTHIPLTVGWQGAINDVALAVEGGLDIYNRLPTDTHFNIKADVPVWTGATLSMSLDQSPYFFNAQTLENGISAWRYGPDLFWQIDPKTSLFSSLRLGHFNDGNFEQQSFSRLERQLWGNTAIAANVFNWSFQQNLEPTSGYFAPPDFLVASLELSWEAEIMEELTCRVAGNVGQQRLNGSWSVGYGHQALCSVDLIPWIDFDLGYNFSNVGSGQSLLSEESAYNNFQLLGGVKTEF